MDRDPHSQKALFEDEGIYCAQFDYRIIRAHVQITGSKYAYYITFPFRML